MKNRFLPIVLVTTLLSLTTGCSGMRDFLFGRGAQCGLCDRITGAVRPLNPLAPPPSQCAPAPAPVYPSPATIPGPCGHAPYTGPVPYVGSGYTGGDCDCGISGYRGVDPYMNGLYPSTAVEGGGWMTRDENGDPIIDVGPTTVTP